MKIHYTDSLTHALDVLYQLTLGKLFIAEEDIRDIIREVTTNCRVTTAQCVWVYMHRTTSKSTNLVAETTWL